MRHKKLIAWLLLGGILLGGIGMAATLLLREHETDEVNTKSTEEQEPLDTPREIVPSIQTTPKQPTEDTEPKADLELNVGEITRDTSPVYIGGSVEQDTKEMPTDEMQP